MLESDFKREFLQRVEARIGTKTPLDYIHTKPYNRSMPDLVILGENRWAALEFKKSARAKHRPNQDYHVDRLNAKCYARFVYPENGEEVLNELERLFLA